jgi:23S rRNA (adenine2503-C2)-methyltransferase
MFEYVMLNGVNDSEADAREMVRLLKGIRSKVNLIPFNPWPGAPYTCSSNNRIHAFGRIIMEAGIASPIRKTRGEDIMAACGQLKSLSELKKGQKVVCIYTNSQNATYPAIKIISLETPATTTPTPTKKP